MQHRSLYSIPTDIYLVMKLCSSPAREIIWAIILFLPSDLLTRMVDRADKAHPYLASLARILDGVYPNRPPGATIVFSVKEYAG